jgi:hypothetical protein
MPCLELLFLACCRLILLAARCRFGYCPPVARVSSSRAGCPSVFFPPGLAWGLLASLASLRASLLGGGFFADAPLPRHALLGICAPRLLPAVSSCRVVQALVLLASLAVTLLPCSTVARFFSSRPSLPGCRSPRCLSCLMDRRLLPAALLVARCRPWSELPNAPLVAWCYRCVVCCRLFFFDCSGASHRFFAGDFSF